MFNIALNSVIKGSHNEKSLNLIDYCIIACLFNEFYKTFIKENNNDQNEPPRKWN